MKLHFLLSCYENLLDWHWNRLDSYLHSIGAYWSFNFNSYWVAIVPHWFTVGVGCSATRIACIMALLLESSAVLVESHFFIGVLMESIEFLLEYVGLLLELHLGLAIGISCVHIGIYWIPSWLVFFIGFWLESSAWLLRLHALSDCNCNLLDSYWNYSSIGLLLESVRFLLEFIPVGTHGSFVNFNTKKNKIRFESF